MTLPTPSRRDLMASMAAGATLAAAPGALAQAADVPKPSLNALAEAKGLRFGSATAVGNPKRGSIDNPAYAAILTGECGLLVPENEMKMYALRPDAERFDFARADQLMAFAAAHGQDVRGHNLLWHNNRWLPQWLLKHDFGSRPASEAERLLVTHVTTVCKHFGDRIKSWDVVNETIDPATGGMRDTVLTRHLGDRVIDIAFHAAREALPNCQLVYNDYMEWEAGSERHRAGVLKLLERLRKDNVPVDALGLQSHIGGDADIASAGIRPQPEAWLKFLHEAVGMGMDLLVTEFDVNDGGFQSDPAKRDADIAAYVRAYFDVTLSVPQVKDVLAWGMVDGFSWLQERTPRADHLPKRPCPYGSDYRAKPMRTALADAFRAAPARGPVHAARA